MRTFRFWQQRRLGLWMALALVMSLLSVGTGSAAEAANVGAVYVLTNATAGNAVMVFNRYPDGSLSPAGSVATGGLGTGGGLGSQGALVLSDNGRWLFAVNAGSNSISSFIVRPDGIRLVGAVDSGGVRPVSLDVHGNLLYVVNAGDSGNISGFSVANNGTLTPIAGSTRPLSNNGSGAAPGPAQISFSPRGNVLVVTEKATNLLDVYTLDNGLPAAQPTIVASSGMTPFGFAFAKGGTLVVSEAFGGAAGQSALSSYALSGDSLSLVSGSVANTQSAACWVAVSHNGKVAYDTNAASGTISSYRIANDGSLSLLEAVAGDTGAGSSPLDMAFNNNDRYLYVLGNGSHAVHGFRVQADGGLSHAGMMGGLPAGSVGIAAR